jgi:alpha,alpha-trehalase
LSKRLVATSQHAYTKHVNTPKINIDSLRSSLVSTAGALIRVKRSHDELLSDLFADVQSSSIYPDGKTFVDLVPRKRVKAIHDEYLLAKDDPQFDLREFVGRHFYDLSTTVHKKDPYIVDPKQTADQHVHALWSYLERRNRLDRGSLFALPYTYEVPGGRFNEQFYWDSYFIMLGLKTEGNWRRIEDMVKNCAYMIRKFGFIPTANRTYFVTRSQPPFFSQMVRLLAEHKGKRVLVEYLPYLLAEYRFWMKGRLHLEKAEHRAFARLVELKDGSLMNRYFDNKIAPRPESLREDTTTAQQTRGHNSNRLFLHLRAAAESGWDFSSRWLDDPQDLHTIHTADIVPVDLNCLLYLLETTIADAYKALWQPLSAHRFRKLAERRKKATLRYCWSKKHEFFTDYNFQRGRKTGALSLAGVFPLYVGIATNEQAALVAERIERDFLKPGGVVTTLAETNQQWDAPNGWAPLQWVTIEGLRRYGYDELAETIRKRWLKLNEHVYKTHHKMIEKYNVVDVEKLGGGGEYQLQDGFGWTNGVYQALKQYTKNR